MDIAATAEGAACYVSIDLFFLIFLGTFLVFKNATLMGKNLSIYVKDKYH